MSRRVGTYSEVKLFSRHVSHERTYPGFAAKTTVKEQLDRGEFYCTRWTPSEHNLGRYGNEPQGTVAYLRLGSREATAIAKPVADVYTALTLDSTYYSTSGGSWENLTDAQTGNVTMGQSDGVPAVMGIRTNWCYGTNPVICLRLWRAEGNREWVASADRNRWPFYTRIGFGGAHGTLMGDPAQFCLHIPYGGEDGIQALAWNPHTAAWEGPMTPVEGTHNLPAFGGLSPGQQVHFWIAALRECLWVSTDGFKSQVAGYVIPARFRDAAGAWHETPYGPSVQQGPVWVTHTAGMFAVAVLPVWMPNAGAGCEPLFQGGPARTVYPIGDNPKDIDCFAWTDRVVDDYGNEVGDVSLTVETIDAYTRIAQVSLEPVAWHGRCADWSGSPPLTYSSPALHAVQLSQDPYLRATGQSYTSSVYDTRAEIEIDGLGVGKPTTGRIVLHNAEGAATGVQDYQRAQVRLGDRLDDGTHTSAVIFTGYVVTPGSRAATAQPGKLEMRLFDAMQRLRDLKAVGDEPDFAMMSPDKGLRWLLGRALVPSGLISGVGSTGTVSTRDVNTETNAWKMQPGRPYLEMVNLVLGQGAGDFSEPDRGGCLRLRYSAAPGWETWLRSSGPFRSTSADYTLRERATPDYGSSLLHIYALEVERHGPFDDEWANCITVLGKGKAHEGQLAMVWYDPNSLQPSHAAFAGGWWHTHTEQDDTLQSLGAVSMRAQVLASQIGQIHREIVTVTTDLIPAVNYGQVFLLSATATGKVAQASAAGCKYRVEQWRHVAGVNRMSRTVLTGKRLAD